MNLRIISLLAMLFLLSPVALAQNNVVCREIDPTRTIDTLKPGDEVITTFPVWEGIGNNFPPHTDGVICKVIRIDENGMIWLAPESQHLLLDPRAIESRIGCDPLCCSAPSANESEVRLVATSNRSLLQILRRRR
jgi:hypothetical protein